MEERLEDIEEKLEKTERELIKVKKENEIEKSNIRANYFLSIFILLAFIIIEKYGETGFNIFGTNIDKISFFIGITLILVLFFIKDLIKYSQYLVKKMVFGIK